MSVRVFIVGTDTAVGKTALTAALLHTARATDLRAIPFKPAQSGDDDPSDIDRLLSAAGLPHTDRDAACPLRYAPALAPGLADDPTPFLAAPSTPSGLPEDPTRSVAPPSLAPSTARDSITPHAITPHAASPDRSRRPPALVTAALDAWETRLAPDLTLIEGAGGLHVPMPGASWQPAWITALAPWTLVVGRTGLGTINHCLSTIEGLRALGRPPLGFVLSQTEPTPDDSVTHNATVIASASGVAHLGTLPHGPEPARVPDLFAALRQRLSL